ncbi:hypothetical protein CLOM_g21941 [Closterium sp. NIES-68]|nr:hypothetical protein CLOM_g21941 [Closterium sp. NIES-68]
MHTSAHVHLEVTPADLSSSRACSHASHHALQQGRKSVRSSCSPLWRGGTSFSSTSPYAAHHHHQQQQH